MHDLATIRALNRRVTNEAAERVQAESDAFIAAINRGEYDASKAPPSDRVAVVDCWYARQRRIKKG